MSNVFVVFISNKQNIYNYNNILIDIALTMLLQLRSQMILIFVSLQPCVWLRRSSAMCITLLGAGFLQSYMDGDNFLHHNITVDFFFLTNRRPKKFFLKKTRVGADKLPRHLAKPAW